MIKRFFSGRLTAIVVTAVIVLLLNYGALYSENYFSSVKFCTSCHGMTYAYGGLKKSAHYGPKGINPECRDCHFPPEFYKKIQVHAVTGVKDIISEMKGGLANQEIYEKRKYELGKTARADIRGWNSSPCRACHKTPVPRSEFGKAAHAGLQGGKVTCVDCHQGIFH